MANTKITAANIDSTSTGITLADLTVDTTTLVVDASNNRVGVGTASPAQTLHVNSGASNVVARFESSDSIAVASFKDNNGEAEIGNIGNDIGFFPAGAEKARLTSGGNFGIGNSSPARNLSVNSGSSSGYIQLVNTASGTGSSNGLELKLDSGGAEADIINRENGRIGFWTNNTERMRIDSSGRLGIGTSSPSQKLDVQGTAMMERSRLSTNDGTTYWDLRRDSSTGHFVISDDGLGDVVTIKQDTGKVGIGISPTEGQLHIKSDSSGEVELLTLENSTGTNGKTTLTFKTTSTDATKSAQIFAERINASGHTDLAFRTFNGSATERMRINSSGQVGIACTDQSNLLTVEANSASSGTDSISVRNRGVSSANHTAGLRFQFNSAVPSAIRSLLTNTSNGEGTLSFFTSSDGTAGNLTERMRIDSSGNVGIATSSPSKLGLTGSSVGKVLHLSGDDCQLRLQHTILHHDHSGNTTTHLRNHYGATDSLARIKYESGYHSWYTGTSFDEKMRLQNSTLYVSTDLGAHSNVTSFAHSTYAHAAVFGANSVPNGTLVVEDYDVSSGIGNTVLRLYLRDQDPATLAVFAEFADGGGRVGSITHNDDGGGVSFNTTSDYRLKENVNYTWDALPLLTQLKPAKFNFIRNPAKTVQGMLAHEVMDIVPSSVRGNKDHMEPIGTITDSEGNVLKENVYEHFCKEGETWTQTGTEPLYQQLDYSRLVPLLTKAMQEQQTIIDDLKSRIEALEG